MWLYGHCRGGGNKQTNPILQHSSLDLINLRVKLSNSRKYSLKLKDLSSGWLLAESCYIGNVCRGEAEPETKREAGQVGRERRAK